MLTDDAVERARDAEQALAELYPRVLEIEDLLRESRDAADDLHDRLQAAEVTVAELEQELDRTSAALAEESEARRFAEYHVELLLQTRVMRVLAKPRAAYGTLRERKQPRP